MALQTDARTTPKSAPTTSAAASLTPDQSNQNLYDQLYSSLLANFMKDFVGSDGNILPQFQFQFPNPVQLQKAVWADPSSSFGQYQSFQAVDRCPVSKAGFFTQNDNSPSVWQYYPMFLKAVIPANVGNLQAYKDALQQQALDARKMNDAINGAGPAFTTWKTQNPASPITDVVSWLTATPPIAQANPWAGNYASAEADSAIQGTIMQQLTETAQPDLSAALAGIANPQFQTSYATSNTGQIKAGTSFVGANDGSQNPSQDWVDWKNGDTSNPDLKQYNARIANGVVPVHHAEKVTITATASYSYFFGLFKATSTIQETFFRDVVTDASFALDMNFASVWMYPVSRPGWFASQVLQSYSKRPLSASNPIDFFNKDTGVLYLLPLEVFLGWNPMLRLTLSTSLYTKWKDQLMSGNGVVLNGVVVGDGVKPKQISSDPTGNTVLEFGDQSLPASKQQLPTILGYVHQKTVGQ